MSKIIWKDIDSSTIKGLMICELPPITKPKMRVQETEVDGVDGSIIEELGYESYDKSIRIGLTRNFDIDEVIKYFTGEGNVVFSNEPNKYYKAKIIEQIDYTRLLRFREAEVKFRVQPFKYEYQEEEQTIEAGRVEGTNVKITDAKITEMQIDGKSIQDGTPTPDTPVAIKSIGTYNEETGKYEIELETTNGTDTNISVIQLDEPLRSLPNGIKDIAYIRNNKLYVDRYVGSIFLNGSENWAYWDVSVNTNTQAYKLTNITNIINNATGETDCSKVMMSNYLSPTIHKSLYDNEVEGMSTYIGNIYIRISRSKGSKLTDFKTWLSTHIIQVIYELASPVTKEIGDLTTIELVDGENNISNSENANMVILYGDNKLIINNLGNYISKPIFEIEGAGTIKFMLNGYSVFTYNFDADGKVIIDSEKEDAYLDAVLKNRNMNGEFPKLEIGENIITWDGVVRNIKVAKKSRWL